jgi:hypothetical protein
MLNLLCEKVKFVKGFIRYDLSFNYSKKIWNKS